MRAIRIHKHGGPEVLQMDDIPTPEPGPGQVRVRVEAAALNHLDIWVRLGQTAPIPLPRTPGSDLAGTIEAAGPGVSRTRIGEPVTAYPGLSCGQCDPCRRGEEPLCPHFQILGLQVDGAYAEHALLPASSAMDRPDNLTPEQAASAPLVFTTAWHALHTRARLQPEETLLVLAGASGVGTAAIQIGKLLGARVIATAGSPDKLQKCRALGADEAINHRNSDYSPRVLELTGGHGANVVLDPTGAETWGRSLASLARGGRMVVFGVTTGASATVQIRPLYQKHHTILGSYLGSRREMQEAMAHIAAGRLKPIVDSLFPLEQAPEAHRRMESSQHFGKIVLKI